MDKLSKCSFLIILIVFTACSDNRKSDLTNLGLTGEDPFFATYAAAMERSSFLIDQGYEFRFYNDDELLGFKSEQGGDIGIGIMIDGEWLYKLRDMYSKPVIHYTFPDMVSFSWHPLKDIRCDAIFLKESSSAAVYDLEFTNTGSKAIEFDVTPFIRNRYRTFGNIRKEDAYFEFDHEKYPDAWTQNQGLPHIDSLTNIFMLDAQVNSMMAVNSLYGEMPKLSFSIRPEKKQEFQITGRGYTPYGERYLEAPPDVRIQAWVDNDRDLIVTENSPLWGMLQPTVTNGFFRLELGSIINGDGDQNISLLYYHEPKDLIAMYDTIAREPFRRDVYPHQNNLPDPPVNLSGSNTPGGFKIQWEAVAPGFTYDIYRRHESQDAYERIAKGVDATSYVDNELARDELYRYLIVSNDTATGVSGIHSRELPNIPVVTARGVLDGRLQPDIVDQVSHLIFTSAVSLEPGQTQKIRLVRTTGAKGANMEKLRNSADVLLDISFEPYLNDNLALFGEINRMANFKDSEWNLLFMSANNLMRQVFYPPEGESSYNYYVFSREPVWGWGHGGQVFHESITMLSYALIDPESAMNSQRVYSERQYPNGYINYRTGSYLNEIIEYNGELTSSAPWYSWLNWEIYKITGDRDFLEEMYDSSKRFYEFFIETRDKDGDGLLEWGGHAVLESVRDALVAVWDEVGWPSNFEGLDINSMMVMEAKALESMALELGLQEEADRWRKDHKKRTELINKYMWDDITGFYYNVDRETNTFTHKEKNDLKRQEIIGFLPLWAGIASEEQADRLVESLTDPEKFWRRYGIPTLAADDPYYNPKGYWNGPVWVQWNYLIVRGLLDYGYEKEAREIVDRVTSVMIKQLKDNHNLWEFYSPDHNWGGYHKTYIWAGIINRMMLDVKHIEP